MPLLQQVLEKYAGKVKIVSKNYPLRSHKLARAAATAVLAAGEQGKYWEYHKKLFENFNKLSEEKFLEFARELGLDMVAFKKSLSDPKHQKVISKDIKEASLAGVTGTPTIFINGKRLLKRSIEGFSAAIDMELKKKSS